MAPELRKRSKGVAGKDVVTKVDEKSTIATKRKAIDDASPVSAKKQKPVKDSKAKRLLGKAAESTATSNETTKKQSKKRTKAPNAAEKQTEEVAETALVPYDGAGESDEDADKDVQALVAGLDSDDEKPAQNGGSEFKRGQDVGKIPKISKRDKKSIQSGSTGEPGVVYVGRLPHGFYEHELRGYFSQFGPVTRIRVSRNKKTGASRHFAFLEFAEAETAEIVAKTMDAYLLFGRILKVKMVPSSQIHESLWVGANRRFKRVPWNKIAGNKLKQPMTESAWAEKISNEEKKRSERAQKLKEIGYDFEGPKLKNAPRPGSEAIAALQDGEVEQKAIEHATEVVPDVAGVQEDEPPAPVTETSESVLAATAIEPKGKKGKKAPKQKKAKV